MSLLLRSLPLIALLRHKPSLSLLPCMLKFHFPNPISKNTRTISSASASASAEALPKPPSIPIKETLDWVSRTGFCGELSVSDVGKRVRLCGWAARNRVHAGLTFLNLRDHTGIVQVATLPNEFPDAHSVISDLGIEHVVAVEGVVRSRPSMAVNEKMKTGSIEVAAENVQVLNTVRSKLPFLVTTSDEAKESIKEEIRLRYRCLDLRRQQMNDNIMLRHRVVKLMRRYLEDEYGFVEAD